MEGAGETSKFDLWWPVVKMSQGGRKTSGGTDRAEEVNCGRK
jgi:hypothetical protein